MRDKERHYMKGSILQESITILNVHKPNIVKLHEAES